MTKETTMSPIMKQYNELKEKRFNRTFMELKFWEAQNPNAGELSFNRTFMELKCATVL